MANASRRTDALVAERTAFLIDFFREHPCADCGESDPVVLEFDHRGRKRFGIAKGIRWRNWRSVLEEIATCEVVCANCHRRRTVLRGGFARLIAAEAATLRDSETDSDNTRG